MTLKSYRIKEKEQSVRAVNWQMASVKSSRKLERGQ